MARAAPLAPGAVDVLWDRDRSIVWTDEHLLGQFLSRNDEQAEAAFTTVVERYGAIVQRVCFDVLG